MAIDRETTLKKAEKFLRQGRLNQAIAEYERILREQPDDWSTTNAIGDLLVRAGQVEAAIEHFTRIADHFFDEGFLPRAAAVYKKILKLAPDADHAALRTAEIAERQGLVADAKAALAHVAARRLKRGDKMGAAEIHLRLGQIDPDDLGAAVAAAKAAAELGQRSAAVERLVLIAAEFRRHDRLEDSVRVLGEAVGIDPDHQAARAELARQLLDAGALERAVEYASSAAQFKAIAAAYYARGRGDDALKVLQWALDQDPADLETRRQLVRSHLGRGDLDAARALLGGTIADTDLLLALAELELRSGHRQEGREAAARALQQEPARRDEVVHLGLRLVASDAAAAFECVDAATDVAAAEHDFAAAAQQLNDYAALAPGHVPALMKLVEVCVDGGLDAEMYAAQARLADAYLEHGQAAEARVIAEDLFAREPWEPSNIERFRRALQLLGEPDPDSVIADRLSGDSPFTSTDLTLDFSFNELARVDEAAPSLVEAPEAEPVASAAPTSGDERPAVAASPGPPSGIDVQDADGEAGEAIEIDLGDTFGAGAESMAAARENAAPVPAALAGLEKVFEGFREEATRHDVLDPAAQLQQGLALEESGQTERAVRLFERAARSPRQRLRAATELARIYRRLGRTRESIEWLERAVESSLPGTEESRELLYDLGLLLAGAGETERALAVLLELKADVPDYRDVARQVARLSQKA